MINLYQTVSNWIKLDQTGSNLFKLDPNWWNLSKHVQTGSNLDFCNLGNLDFGKLEHWVTWALSNLDFEQFGQLGHWTPWVTWTLDSLGDLDFGKLVNCNYWETYDWKTWRTLFRLKVFQACLMVFYFLFITLKNILSL